MKEDKNWLKKYRPKLSKTESVNKIAFDKKREKLREQSKDKYIEKAAKIEKARSRKHALIENIRK